MLRTLRSGRDELDEGAEEEGGQPSATDRAHAEALATLETWLEEALANEETYAATGWDAFKHYPTHADVIRASLGTGAS